LPCRFRATIAAEDVDNTLCRSRVGVWGLWLVTENVIEPTKHDGMFIVQPAHLAVAGGTFFPVNRWRERSQGSGE
jgi:hypothetical protein